MRIALFFMMLTVTGWAQTFSGGVSANGTVSAGAQLPVLTLSSESATASTIEASFTTKWTSTPTLVCGTSPGVYTFTSVDSGISAMLQQIVEGLTPSTTYYCKVSVTNSAGTVSATFTKATTALPPTTPVTGASLGSISSYNVVSSPHYMSGDTLYNCNSNDGITYLTTADTYGWDVSWGTGIGSNLLIAKFSAELPFVGMTVNQMSAYGGAATNNGVDSRSPKPNGLFCMAGDLIAFTSRENASLSPTPQSAGSVMWSSTHGTAWNNYQAPTVFVPDGALMSPTTTTMFTQSPSTWDATWIMYCGDDGTLGYLSTCNQQDNANAFLYAIANEGFWNAVGTSGGGNYYLARVPRAKVLNLTRGDWQCFTGGDGSVDANWTTNFSNCVPILTNTYNLSTANVQYFPSLNRYVLLTFNYPNGSSNSTATAVTNWLGYEAPHPWGPWTLIYSASWTAGSSPPGAYNPIFLNDTTWTGSAPTILFTGNFLNQSGFPGTGFNYQMYYATLTLTH